MLLASPSHVTSRGLARLLNGDQLHSPAPPRVPGPLLLSLQSALSACTAGDRSEEELGVGRGVPSPSAQAVGRRDSTRVDVEMPAPGTHGELELGQERLLGKAALNTREAETRQLPGSDLGTKAGACSPPPSPATPSGPPAGRGAAPSRAAAE